MAATAAAAKTAMVLVFLPQAILLLLFFCGVSASEFAGFHAALEKSLREAQRSRRSRWSGTTVQTPAAVRDCMENFERTAEQLQASLAAVKKTKTNLHGHPTSSETMVVEDVHTWVSAALTNLDSCLAGLAGVTPADPSSPQSAVSVRSHARTVTASVASALSLFRPWASSLGVRGRGRMLLPRESGTPTWLDTSVWNLTRMPRRTLLRRADVVVAKDGSGHFTSVGSALKAVAARRRSSTGGSRIVIHVKAGIYKENVRISSKMKNIMMLGDGASATLFVGSRSFADGWTTFDTATFGVSGDGFIARDMSFINTAGAAKHQAVALRLGSDKSVIYRCHVEGYQDTLYAHSLRQFYRDCTISGTVDFVFGNAAAVLQHCDVVARKPMHGQFVTVTAQGRSHPDQNTGFSFHACTLSGMHGLPTQGGGGGEAIVYLGRPWRAYSRTVFMQCSLGDVVNPRGWHPWSGQFGLKTLFYGEYGNYGPGAGVASRVRWPGFHVMTAAQANVFTVKSFISGDTWLPSTGVVFDSGLL